MSTPSHKGFFSSVYLVERGLTLFGPITAEEKCHVTRFAHLHGLLLQSMMMQSQNHLLEHAGVSLAIAINHF